jgi:hypothetical protein
MPEETAAFLREQAEKCRWLARNSTDPNVITTLNEMAREYVAKAEKLDAAGPFLPPDQCDQPPHTETG